MIFFITVGVAKAMNVLTEFTNRSIQHALLWILVAIASLFILVALSIAIPPPSWLVDELTKTVSELQKTATTQSPLGLAIVIFTNNARVALLLSIPLANIAIYISVMLMTAWTGRMLAELIAGKSWPTLLAVLLASPHSYLEFMAYSIVLVEGLLLGLKLVKRRVGRVDLCVYGLHIAMALALLALAAIAEISVLGLARPM